MAAINPFNFGEFMASVEAGYGKNFEQVKQGNEEKLKSIFTEAAMNDDDNDNTTYSATLPEFNALVNKAVAWLKTIPNVMRNSLPNNLPNSEDA